METTIYYNNDYIRVVLGFKDLHASFDRLAVCGFGASSFS